MQNINKEILDTLRITCYDYIYKNNSANLRERYAFLFVEGNVGIQLVECNTNGKFIVKENAGLSEAYFFIHNT